MNLVEAVKSRKPFRRPSDCLTYGKDFWIDPDVKGGLALGKDDILAEDWEIKGEHNEQ